MKKESTVWKVLEYRTRGSIGLKPTSEFFLRYPAGKFIKPKTGKIFCFKKKEDATEFVFSNKKIDKWSIHKATAINAKAIDTQAIHEDQISRYWSGKTYGWLTPKGSMICDSLKCLD